MRLYWVPQLVLSALILSSCGKTDVSAYAGAPPHPQSETAGTHEDDDPSIAAWPFEVRVRQAASGKLTCENAENCHPAVVMISVVVNKTIERCSGFLIDRDLVMTNDHCLAHSLSIRQGSNQCRNLIFAHFAAAGGRTQEQAISCKSIVVRSHQSGLGSKDYAVFRLERPVTDRAPLKLSQRGFADGEAATIYRVQMRQNPATGTYDGVQSRLQCKATYSTLVYPGVQNSRSPLMTFGNCPIQKGNSGSAVLNAQGEAGAIIQGFLTPPDDATLRDQLQALLLDEYFGNVGIGTQLACAIEVVRPQQACTAIPRMYTRYPRPYVSEAGEFNPALLPATNSTERWNPMPARSKNEKMFIRTPKCVNPGVNGSSFQAAIVSYQLGINRSLKAEWRLVIQPGDHVLVFNSVSGRTQEGRVSYKNPDFGSIELPVCTRLSVR